MEKLGEEAWMGERKGVSDVSKSDSDLAAPTLYTAHPSFRLIATAELPTPTSPWLTDTTTLQTFMFHSVSNLIDPQTSASELLSATVDNVASQSDSDVGMPIIDSRSSAIAQTFSPLPPSYACHLARSLPTCLSRAYQDAFKENRASTGGLSGEETVDGRREVYRMAQLISEVCFDISILLFYEKFVSNDRST